jgi:hypothetical protein
MSALTNRVGWEALMSSSTTGVADPMGHSPTRGMV